MEYGGKKKRKRYKDIRIFSRVLQQLASKADRMAFVKTVVKSNFSQSPFAVHSRLHHTLAECQLAQTQRPRRLPHALGVVFVVHIAHLGHVIFVVVAKVVGRV